MSAPQQHQTAGTQPEKVEPAMLSSWSVPVGRIFGIPVRLHVLFVIVLIIAFINYRWSWVWFAWAFLLFGPILLLTILVHELGHCLATRKLGAEVHGILLWPLGGLAFVGHTSTPGKDLLVAVAGPITHIPMFFIWYIISVALPQPSWREHGSLQIVDPTHHFFLAVCVGAAVMNLYLMAFNLLLPAYPLDGGRIFADSLLLCKVREEIAAVITLVLAVGISIGLIIYGAMHHGWQMIMVGAWMLFSSYGLFQAVYGGTVRQHPMFNYASTAEEKPNSTILPNNHASSAHV